MSTKRRRQSARARFLSKRVAGWISLDMFRMSIPIFLTNTHCIEVLKHEGIEVVPDDGKVVQGYAGWGTDAEGVRLHYVMLPPDSNTNTWVHEASHLVDFIIDYLGLDPSIDGTETRAYMLGHIFSSIEEIMLPIQDRLSLPMVITAAPYNEKPL